MVTRGPDHGSMTWTDFPGKDPGEVFQSSFRQHWIRILWPITKALLLTLLILTIGFLTFFAVDIGRGTARHLVLVFLLLFFLVIQFEFLIRFYRYFLYVVVVTDRKVHRIKKTLLTTDEHECVDLWMLQEINKRQRGPIQNLLGFGSMVLEAQDTRMTLHFVPQIERRYAGIMSLREQARASGRRMSLEPAAPSI